jgi:hypothetical protein
LSKDIYNPFFHPFSLPVRIESEIKIAIPIQKPLTKPPHPKVSFFRRIRLTIKPPDSDLFDFHDCPDFYPLDNQKNQFITKIISITKITTATVDAAGRHVKHPAGRNPKSLTSRDY